MPRVIRTPQARLDLKAIGRRVVQESKSRSVAERFLRKIDQKCQLYATQPHMAPVYDQYRPGLRAFPVGDYVVFYHALDDGILIYRVLHGRRKIEDLL